MSFYFGCKNCFRPLTIFHGAIKNLHFVLVSFFQKSINQEIKQLDAVLNFFDRLRDERNTNSKSKPSQLETDIERKNLIPSSPGS